MKKQRLAHFEKFKILSLIITGLGEVCKQWERYTIKLGKYSVLLIFILFGNIFNCLKVVFAKKMIGGIGIRRKIIAFDRY